MESLWVCVLMFTYFTNTLCQRPIEYSKNDMQKYFESKNQGRLFVKRPNNLFVNNPHQEYKGETNSIPIFKSPPKLSIPYQVPKFNKPQFDYKIPKVTKQIHDIYPNTFNINQSPKFNLDFKAPPKKPADSLLAASFKPNDIIFNDNEYNLDLPKDFGSQFLIPESEVKPTAIDNNVPAKFDTFVPGGDTGNFDVDLSGAQKGGDANSFVKVRNGKTTYEYAIRHMTGKA